VWDILIDLFEIYGLLIVGGLDVVLGEFMECVGLWVLMFDCYFY